MSRLPFEHCCTGVEVLSKEARFASCSATIHVHALVRDVYLLFFVISFPFSRLAELQIPRDGHAPGVVRSCSSCPVLDACTSPLLPGAPSPAIPRCQLYLASHPRVANDKRNFTMLEPVSCRKQAGGHHVHLFLCIYLCHYESAYFVHPCLAELRACLSRDCLCHLRLLFLQTH